MTAPTAKLRPEYLPPVALNPHYALSIAADASGSSHTHTPDRRILATHLPGGFWAVKIRQRDGGWVVFAVPRCGTVAEPFDLATGTTYESVLMAGIGWRDSASVLTMRGDRVVFAGLGDATEETPLDGRT